MPVDLYISQKSVIALTADSLATETEELLVIMEGHGRRKSLVHHLFHIWIIVIMTYQLPDCNQDISSDEVWRLSKLPKKQSA